MSSEHSKLFLMNLLDYEIEEVKKRCHNVIENSRLVTCMKTLVIQFNYTKNRLKK